MAAPDEILSGILEEARRLLGDSVREEMASHAAALASAGAGPAKVIDEVLLFLLHRGESHALKHGAGVEDSLGVRPILRNYLDYPERLKEAGAGSPDRLKNSRKNIQVMVTRQCNLRCGYCPVFKCDRWMDGDVLRGVVGFLLSSRQRRLRLDFTGGEPLYRFDLIMEVCEEGMEKAGASGKELSFYMVTNGTLLDERMAKKLARLPILLEISMDGDREAHNKFKIPVESSMDPYKDTRRAVDLMLQEGTDFYAVMVATPETAPLIGQNFDHILSTGVRSVDINYSIGRMWSSEKLREYVEQIEKLLERHHERIASGELKIGNITRRVEPSILNAEWMADTDGSLHLMTEWVFQSSFKYRPEEFSFGSVLGSRSFDDFYVDRFHAYYTLLLSAGWRNPALRRIIHNNIEVGRRVGKCFTGRATKDGAATPPREP